LNIPFAEEQDRGHEGVLAMKILHSELVSICNILLDALSKSDVCEINSEDSKEFVFQYDFYWEPEERHTLHGEPKEMHIGSVAHDLERIKQCIQTKDPMHHDFR
jgi:hypothetical protein